MGEENLTITRKEDENVPPETLWAYYIDAAGKRWSKKSFYSMLWYYDAYSDLTKLDTLTKAFLGVGDAMAALAWNEDIPSLQFRPDQCYLEESKLNDSQKNAIQIALTKPVSFIKGPPGTGKTQVILHLASCIAANGRTAAIVSCNNAALENIHEKVRGFPDAGVNRTRLKSKLAGLGNGGRIAEFVLEHQPRNQAQEAYEFRGFQVVEKKDIRLGKDNIEYFPERVKRKYQEEQAQKKINMEELSEKEKNALPSWLRYTVEKRPSAEEFLEHYPIITSTVHSLQKCFSNEKRYQYDYVIIDETSQLDVLVGLTAMGCARHLVLVGDSDQLPPVLNEQAVRKLNQSALAGQIKSITNRKGEPIYLLNEKRSFLDVCLDVFNHGRNPDVPTNIRVMLDTHYRCHRGIFNFCKEKIYDPQITEEEKKLKICTPKEKYCRTSQWECPIKVLWFEGDYCESGYKDKEKTQPSRLNRKQIDIFIEEEMEYLYHYLWQNRKEDPSVCILSPFRGQLAALRAAINQWCESRGVQLRIQQSDEKKAAADIPDSSEPAFLSVGLSTVHKSQGQEFDVVYLLPVEDTDWEWPWSQQKRLVNVAVSRAVQELRLITSSALMEENIQRALTENRYIEPSRKLSEGDRKKQEPEELYIQKLVAYVRNKTIHENCPYGFHQTRLRSVFDRAAFLRSERRKVQKDAVHSSWEECLWDELRKMRIFRERNLQIYSEVSICDILSPEEIVDKDLSDYMNDGTRFDFMVCDRENRILLVVEVDGEQHRHQMYWERAVINKSKEHMREFLRWMKKEQPEQCAELEKAYQKGEEKDSLKLPEGVRKSLAQWAKEQLEKQIDKDEKKDRLVTEVFRAALYRGNRRKNEPKNKDAAFAVLRLPTDGSTCLEVRALRTEQPLQDKYFTIEDLIEEQLERAPDRLWCYKPLSLTTLLHEKSDIGENTTQVQQVLAAHKYLEKGPDGKYRPTEQGVRKGIAWACRFTRGKDEPACFPVYSGKAAAFLEKETENLKNPVHLSNYGRNEEKQ